MPHRKVSAEVISCPGRLGDIAYSALQIDVDGFGGPYVLTLALPAVGCRALSKQVDPMDLYRSLADAINTASIGVEFSEDVEKSPAKPIRRAA